MPAREDTPWGWGPVLENAGIQWINDLYVVLCPQLVKYMGLEWRGRGTTPSDWTAESELCVPAVLCSAETETLMWEGETFLPGNTVSIPPRLWTRWDKTGTWTGQQLSPHSNNTPDGLQTIHPCLTLNAARALAPLKVLSYSPNILNLLELKIELNSVIEK